MPVIVEASQVTVVVPCAKCACRRSTSPASVEPVGQVDGQQELLEVDLAGRGEEAAPRPDRLGECLPGRAHRCPRGGGGPSGAGRAGRPPGWRAATRAPGPRTATSSAAGSPGRDSHAAYDVVLDVLVRRLQHEEAQRHPEALQSVDLAGDEHLGEPGVALEHVGHLSGRRCRVTHRRPPALGCAAASRCSTSRCGAGGEVEVLLHVAAARGRQLGAQRRGRQRGQRLGERGGRRAGVRRGRCRPRARWRRGPRRRRRPADGDRPSPRARRWAARRGPRCCRRPTGTATTSAQAYSSGSSMVRPATDELHRVAEVVALDGLLQRRLLDPGADDPEHRGDPQPGDRVQQRREALLLDEPTHRQDPEPAIALRVGPSGRTG